MMSNGGFDLWYQVRRFADLDPVQIDGWAFRLHYWVTSTGIFAASAVAFAKQYFGDPIECIFVSIMTLTQKVFSAKVILLNMDKKKYFLHFFSREGTTYVSLKIFPVALLSYLNLVSTSKSFPNGSPKYKWAYSSLYYK